MKHGHYFKDVSHYDTVDVYRVLQLFGVTDPAVQHAVKKLLAAGGRGAKDRKRDLQEALDSIQRALEMIVEDEPTRQIPILSTPIPCLSTPIPGLNMCEGCVPKSCTRTGQCDVAAPSGPATGLAPGAQG